MADVAVGNVLDVLGVTLDLDDGEHVTDVLVIAKLSDVNDGSRDLIAIGESDGISMITKAGLLAMAKVIIDRSSLR